MLSVFLYCKINIYMIKYNILKFRGVLMKHIKYILSLFLVFTVVFSAGCGINEIKNNELKIGVSGMNGAFNPFYAESTADKQISGQIYQTIQRRNSNNKMVNFCGDISYEIDGEKVKYTVSINKNLYFSDGSNVTIDDVIFFYYFISDATYDGPYKDFYLNDIAGIKEYYFDDSGYGSNLRAIEEKVISEYSQAAISPENLEKYLVESNLAEKFSEEKAPDGQEWKAYFEKNGMAAEFEKLGKKAEASSLLALCAKAEAKNNALSYNAENWYREKLNKEYLEKNYSNGIGVTKIKGIKKINDYTCTVQFNSPDINAVSALNVPIISKEFYSSLYVKGMTSKVKEYYEAAPGCGPYIIEEYKNGKAVLSANKYYPDAAEFSKLLFVDYFGKEDKMYKDAISGKIDITTVKASTERINGLSGKEAKYFITYDDGYYSLFFNSKKLNEFERKGLSGICDLGTAVEQSYGKYYAVPLRPLSIRFEEYPEKITEKKYSSLDFTNYQLKGTRKLSSLNAYCIDDFSNELLVRFGEILAEKNIKLKIFKVSAEELEAAVRNSKADIWVEMVSDGPTGSKYDYYNSLGAKNISGFINPDIDSLTDKIKTSVGIYDRSQLIEKLLEMISDQAIEQPVCQLQNVTIYNLKSISETSFGSSHDHDDFTFFISELKMN